jgi:hypothetical protein
VEVRECAVTVGIPFLEYVGKDGTKMAQRYTARQGENPVDEGQAPRNDVASPLPLGLGLFALATALLGCYYAGFVIRYDQPGARIALGAMLIGISIALILAGMWEFRKNATLNATIFTSYGGFLLALGLFYTPSLGVFGTVSTLGVIPLMLGLFFLCWTIYTAILTLGAYSVNSSFTVILGLLCLAFLVLTIGQLAGANVALRIIGGWIAIICALVAWAGMAMSIMERTHTQENFHWSLGDQEERRGHRIPATD